MSISYYRFYAKIQNRKKDNMHVNQQDVRRASSTHYHIIYEHTSLFLYLKDKEDLLLLRIWSPKGPAEQYYCWR